MKVLLLPLLLVLISCEQPSNSSSESVEKAPVDERQTISIDALGAYTNGEKMLESECRQVGSTNIYKTTSLRISDNDTLIFGTKEYYNDTCFFPSGAATVGHHYNWHANFTEVDGVISGFIHRSRMTTFFQIEIENTYCSTDFQVVGRWDDVDYAGCKEDRTGEEVEFRLIKLPDGRVEIDGVAYTVI